MTKSYFDVTVIKEENEDEALKQFRSDVIQGLSRPQKQISSMYFYDDVGSGTVCILQSNKIAPDSFYDSSSLRY